MATDYGTDVSTFPGVDPTFTIITGPRVVAENLLRRFSTPRGSMWAHPDFGLDLRSYLNAEVTDEAMFLLVSDMESEAIKDERVFDAAATAEFDEATETITAEITVSLAEGTFRLVLLVSQVTVQLVSFEEEV